MHDKIVFFYQTGNLQNKTMSESILGLHKYKKLILSITLSLGCDKRSRLVPKVALVPQYTIFCGVVRNINSKRHTDKKMYRFYRYAMPEPVKALFFAWLCP